MATPRPTTMPDAASGAAAADSNRERTACPRSISSTSAGVSGLPAAAVAPAGRGGAGGAGVAACVAAGATAAAGAMCPACSPKSTRQLGQERVPATSVAPHPGQRRIRSICRSAGDRGLNSAIGSEIARRAASPQRGTQGNHEATATRDLLACTTPKETGPERGLSSALHVTAAGQSWEPTRRTCPLGMGSSRKNSSTQTTYVPGASVTSSEEQVPSPPSSSEPTSAPAVL